MRKILIVLMAFVLTGCIHSIDKQGVTITVPAYKITQTLKEQFPVSKDLKYGRVTLQNPEAFLRAGSDRVKTGIDIGFSSSLIPTQKGSIVVSGKPVFDAKSGAVYLLHPDIEKLEFNNYKLSSMITPAIKRAIMPIVDDIFRRHPIYRLNKNSLQSMFVKDIKVSNGELLISFGL